MVLTTKTLLADGPESAWRKLIGLVAVWLMRRGWRPPARLPQRGLERLLDDIQHAHPSSTITLTAKERRTLTLLAHGLTENTAAQTAGIGRETIKSQVRSIMAKLGARNTTHAVALALRDGVIDLDDNA